MALQGTRTGKKKTIVAGSGYTSLNRAELVKGGKHFFDLLTRLIREARHSIHIQTYALDDDDTGKMVADALKESAAKGVKIYVLADGYASQKLSKSFINDLKTSGIQFRYFEPLLRSRFFYFGRRLHHKVAVFDSLRAVVGSMNIADRYNDNKGEKSWLDMALFVEGEAALKLEAICWQFWLKKKHKLQPAHEALEHVKSIPENERVSIRIRQNDWVMRKIEISRSYNSLLRNATDNVYIMCSYFLPGKRMLRQLRRASARGVRIHVVLAGTSDVKTAKFAERYLYRWMFRHKLIVYEYQPTVLHAKLGIADGNFMTIGSYNINGLSAYASIELNLDVNHAPTCLQFEDQVKKIIKNDCKQVNANDYVYRLFTPRQLLYWLSYQLMNLMLMVTTFYYKQHD